jgi:hypothetical protein
MDTKKMKRKSMHGSALRKGEKPPSMQKIVEEIRRDRRESDERRERVFDALFPKKDKK